MVTVTLQELMAQTNALPEDATLLELYADAAEEQIEVDINRPLSDLLIEAESSDDDDNAGTGSEATGDTSESTSESTSSESAGSYPKKIKLAVLLLVGHWYRNRESFSTVEMKEVPKTYNTLVASFRDYAKPYRS